MSDRARCRMYACARDVARVPAEMTRSAADQIDALRHSNADVSPVVLQPSSGLHVSVSRARAQLLRQVDALTEKLHSQNVEYMALLRRKQQFDSDTGTGARRRGRAGQTGRQA